MPLGDLGNHTYGSKSWYDELARRIADYSHHGQKEIFTPSYYVTPLQPRDHALLSTMSLQLRNRYQRGKLNEKRIMQNEKSTA